MKNLSFIVTIVSFLFISSNAEDDRSVYMPDSFSTEIANFNKKYDSLKKTIDNIKKEYKYLQKTKRNIILSDECKSLIIECDSIQKCIDKLISIRDYLKKSFVIDTTVKINPGHPIWQEKSFKTIEELNNIDFSIKCYENQYKKLEEYVD